ncbi:MAG: DUF1146 domain-containing protein [Solobacterium sp.]|nr:DUF1146 domain-containing protein [Solobacterium sp.]
MGLTQFLLRAAVYAVCFCASFYSMGALDYEKCLRQNHVYQARLLYVLLAMALGYLSGSFIISFIYRI